MHIIISGVAGFIGSNLAKYLINQTGFSVTGIDNFSYGNASNIESLIGASNFRFIEGDLKNYETIATLQGDVFVHLASQKIPRYDNSLRTLEENQILTDHVIRKCLEGNIKLVFASTSDVYGKNTQVPFAENADLVLGPTYVKRWAYAVSKIYSEHKIIANGHAKGLNYSIVRFFGSFGTNQNLTWWGGPQSVFINKAFENEPIEIHGDGLQTRTFTYVLDTVEALFKVITNSKSDGEIFNIAGNPNEEIQIVELAKLIWELIRPGEEAKLKFIPYETFGNYEDVSRRVPNIDKICNILDFKPQYNLKQGLLETIAWQKKYLAEHKEALMDQK